MATANYKSQSPKQNVCCVNRSAGISGAVWGAQLGYLPLRINGTTQSGMEYGGPELWLVLYQHASFQPIISPLFPLQATTLTFSRFLILDFLFLLLTPVRREISILIW